MPDTHQFGPDPGPSTSGPGSKFYAKAADDEVKDEVAAVDQSEGGESSSVKPALGAVAGHEVNPSDHTAAHRLVATGMVITFLIVFISQDWWTKVRDFIGTKVHGPSTTAKPGG